MGNALVFAAKLLELLPLVVQGVTAAADLMQWGAEKVKAMAEEGRDPTDAEWQEVNDRTSALLAELNAD